MLYREKQYESNHCCSIPVTFNRQYFNRKGNTDAAYNNIYHIYNIYTLYIYYNNNVVAFFISM